MNERPAVMVQPGIRFGRPHIRGISTGAIAAQYWAGDPVEVVMDEYHLTRYEVLLALWFEGTYGGRKRVWGEWAEEAYVGLARGHLEMGLPPDRNGET